MKIKRVQFEELAESTKEEALINFDYADECKLGFYKNTLRICPNLLCVYLTYCKNYDYLEIIL